MGESKKTRNSTEPSAAYGTFSSSTESSPASSDAPTTQPCTRSSLTSHVSPISKLFFLWFEDLVDVTKTRAIRIEDVFELDEENRSAATYDLFMAHMNQPRDFVWTMWWLYWRLIVESGLLALVGAVGDALNPLLMYVVIAAVTNAETPVTYIVGMLVARHGVKVVAQLAKKHSRDLDSIVATRAIGALQTLVFDATLSSTWSQEVTVSEISNLFCELGTVHDLLTVLHMIWLTPLSLAANLYLLYYLLGDAVVGCIIAASALQLMALFFGRFNRRVAKHLHVYQGRRLQIMGECFKTIQSIKLHAWEHRFLRKIQEQRKKERALISIIALVDAMWRSLLVILPEIVLAGSFAVLFSMENAPRFNPAMAFASLSILYETKNIVGNVVTLVYIVPSTTVTMKQVFHFLDSSQRPSRRNQNVAPSASATTQDDMLESDDANDNLKNPFGVRIHDAAIGRSSEEPLLIMANLTVPVGTLTVIHGNTGAGKSTLLEAMIDNSLLLNPTRASIHVQGRVAYCSQDPWLQTLSIRENILFGLPYDEEKYRNVLRACCLLRDLGALPHGDDTVIGPKGLTLSGGQKARIALARACYADADVYLLDSPLSSVDAIVQGDIFRRCIIDLLKHKTVVLVTHNEEVVSSKYVDQVVLVEDHRVMVETAPSDSRGRPTKSSVSKRCSLTAETRSLSGITRVESSPVTISTVPVSTSTRPRLCLMPLQSSRLEHEWRRLELKKVANKHRVATASGTHLDSASAPLQSARTYLALCGGVLKFLVPCVTFYALSRGGLISGHLWISSWSEQARSREVLTQGAYNSETFLLLIGVCSLWAFIGSMFTLTPTSNAAEKLFDRMVRGVLFAPMTFFYSQPIGEIMTRFSVDVRMIDEEIGYVILDAVFVVVGVLMPWIVLTVIMPEMLCVVPAMVWLLYKCRFQMKAALEIRWLVSSSHTPCFDAISEAINGRHVIQAFGPAQVARFQRDHQLHLDQLLQMKHADSVMENWSILQFVRVDTLLLLGLVAAVAARRNSLIPLFGLALHYLVTINNNLTAANAFLLHGGSDVVKVQRVLEYCTIQPEQVKQESILPRAILPPEWPNAGEITFDNVSFQYDDLSGPVLQNIQLHIRPGEKIGLVGRTGSGKSSLTMALFRIHELVSGRILIDGVDIGLADLYAVRSRLSIIPQSPLFFQGTLRSYLDPFDEMDDVTLWEALRKTGLASVVTRMEGKLLAQLQENAENLSLGERQLLCLSRVLLKPSRVVVLDEATAAMDHESDETLQRVLKSEFREATVISIAHRLDSILAFDRVVVLEDGRIVQCGTVEELVSDATGPFFDLLEGALLKM